MPMTKSNKELYEMFSYQSPNSITAAELLQPVKAATAMSIAVMNIIVFFICSSFLVIKFWFTL